MSTLTLERWGDVWTTARGIGGIRQKAERREGMVTAEFLA
jgi:hypothetical protein